MVDAPTEVDDFDLLVFFVVLPDVLCAPLALLLELLVALSPESARAGPAVVTPTHSIRTALAARNAIDLESDNTVVFYPTLKYRFFAGFC